MANELNVDFGVTGISPTAQLILGTTLQGTAISLSQNNSTTLYTGSVPNGTPAGSYSVKFVAGSLNASGTLQWDGSKEVTSLTLESLLGVGLGSVSVTITVTDGTNPIQNAVVNLLVNASHYFATTNSSGVAVLTPTEGNATYTVQLTANGYQFTPTTLVVSGATSHTYAMSQISITPSTLPLVTGYLVAYDSAGNALAGVSHTVRYVAPPVGDTGSSFPKLPTWDVSTGSNGVAQWVGLIAGAQYTVRRGTGPEVPFTASLTGTFKLPDCSG